MKIKKVHFSTMSPLRCDCGNLIKQNVANRKEGRLVCFTCYRMKQASKDHFMKTAREIRQNPNLRSQRRVEKHIPLRRANG